MHWTVRKQLWQYCQTIISKTVIEKHILITRKIIFPRNFSSGHKKGMGQSPAETFSSKVSKKKLKHQTLYERVLASKRSSGQVESNSDSPATNKFQKL